MAQQTFTRILDDLDGGEATQTISFGFQGSAYEIDLNDKNARLFTEAITPFIEAARRVRGSGSGSGRGRSSMNGAGPKPQKRNLEAIRSWAKEQGMTVADRGRVASAIIDAYDHAQHGGPASNGGNGNAATAVAAAPAKAPAKAAPAKAAAKKTTARKATGKKATAKKTTAAR